MNVIDLTVDTELTVELVARFPDGQEHPVAKLASVGPGKYDFDSGYDELKIKGTIIVKEHE